jgi:Ala-tRNA(Pro) deacylase
MMERLMTLEEKIISILEEKKIGYEIVEHEPVYTNPAMAEALNVNESETVKSLVLKTKEGKLIVMVLPGDKKVDWKKAAAGAKTKKVSFFGHLTFLPIYMDPALTKKDFIYFNPGVHDKSFKIKAWDLKKICNPAFVKF